MARWLWFLAALPLLLFAGCSAPPLAMTTPVPFTGNAADLVHVSVSIMPPKDEWFKNTAHVGSAGNLVLSIWDNGTFVSSDGTQKFPRDCG